MRSRSANELKQRSKVLLRAIQREYAESQSTKKSKTSEPISPSTSKKENDKKSEKSHDKKAKRKSWMPTISFAVPNRNEPKPKQAANADTATANAGTASDAIASTSGLPNKSIAVRKMSLDMPALDWKWFQEKSLKNQHSHLIYSNILI